MEFLIDINFEIWILICYVNIVILYKTLSFGMLGIVGI